ncbi:MAG: EAL domain-containing protein [Ketobacteraceae bacterium]|nr:EAL domain-containing protein [Ketobacteraceae bacterium]
MPAALYGLKLLGLTFVYIAGAQAGLSLSVFYGDVSPLWPPSGIAVAVFWLFGWRWWPMILLGDVAIALSLNQSLQTGLWGALTQSIEAAIAVGLISQLKLRPELNTFRDAFWFICTVAILPPAVGGALGAANLFLLGEITAGHIMQSAITWWLGDALGILIITPLITCWQQQRPLMKLFMERWLLTTLITCIIFLGLFRYFPENTSLMFFLLLPYVVYSAIYMGTQGTSLSLLVLSLFVLGEGIINPGDDFMYAVKMAFIGTCAMSGYFMSALIRENTLSRNALTEEKIKAQTTLESISDGVIATDLDGKVLFLNPTAEKITGWSDKAAAGCSILEVCPLFEGHNGDHQLHPVTQFLSRKAQDQDHYIYRFPNRKSELRVIDARIKYWRIRNSVAGTVIVLRDVTDEASLKEELSFQAYHDEITGLPNRRAFNDELADTIAQRKSEQKYALIYMDLDQFKLINDTCGHEVGDLMLIEIGELVKDHVKHGGFAARISGDEFGLIIPMDNEPHAMAVAESLRSRILDYRYHHEDLVFSVGASIGLTYIHERDKSATAVLARADIACYQAKETGRNKISVYHAEDTEMLRYQSEIEWISQLKRALVQNRFLLYRQGVHDLTGQKPCTHYEILIRLKQDDRILSPGSFLPVAERFGFMPVIDRWVTEKTFEYLKQHPEDTAIYNINLCGASLNDKKFFADVTALAERTGINPHQICFEVTERVAIQKVEEIASCMQDLIDQGFRFALDDFGSGVASHAYLEQLPIHYVKLDGRFVRTLSENQTSQIIIESLAKIAHLKGIQCIAEWVEDDTSISTLVSAGITLGQGYWFDKPAPISEETPSSQQPPGSEQRKRKS